MPVGGGALIGRAPVIVILNYSYLILTKFYAAYYYYYRYFLASSRYIASLLARWKLIYRCIIIIFLGLLIILILLRSISLIAKESLGFSIG